MDIFLGSFVVAVWCVIYYHVDISQDPSLWWNWGLYFFFYFYFSIIIDLLSPYLSLSYLFLCLPRQHPGQTEGSILHRSIRAGACEAAGGWPAALGRAVLPRRQSDSRKWCCQTTAGPRCCYQGPGSKRLVCDRPWETGHRERPVHETNSDGKKNMPPPPTKRRCRNEIAVCSLTCLLIVLLLETKYSILPFQTRKKKSSKYINDSSPCT